MSFKITIDIPDERISDLLCSAFEGGSNYWYTELEAVFPEGAGRADFEEGGKFQIHPSYYHWSQLVPLIEGGQLKLKDATDGKGYTIDRAKLQSGLQIFAVEHSRSFADFIEERDDAATADCFLQCVVFGKEIYG